MSLHQYNVILIVVDLILKSEVLQIYFSIYFLPIMNPFHFRKNFRICLPIPATKPAGILTGTVLLWMELISFQIFTEYIEMHLIFVYRSCNFAELFSPYDF